MASEESRCLIFERLAEFHASLKAQRTTHKDILRIGTALLNEFHQLMLVEKSKAIEEAIKICIRHEREIFDRELTDAEMRWNSNKKSEMNRARQEHQQQMHQLQLESSAREMEQLEQFRIEKSESLERALIEAERDFKLVMNQSIHNAVSKAQSEWRIDEDKAQRLKMAETVTKLKLESQRQVDEAKAELKTYLTTKHVADTHRLVCGYEGRCLQLESRVLRLEHLLEKETASHQSTSQQLKDFIEDYKRFQDHTRGFHSDFLLP